MNRGLVALARLIRKGRIEQRTRAKLCGSCANYIRGRCVVSSCNFREAPVSKDIVWSNLESPFALELVRCDECHVVKDCTGPWPAPVPTHKEPIIVSIPEPPDWVKVFRPLDRPAGNLCSGGCTQDPCPKAGFGELSNPDRSYRISEERRVFLWNRHMDEKRREFADLLDRDAERQAMEAILDVYGVEYDQENVEQLQNREDVTELVTDVNESQMAELEKQVDQLTTAIKTRNQRYAYEANPRAAQGS